MELEKSSVLGEVRELLGPSCASNGHIAVRTSVIELTFRRKPVKKVGVQTSSLSAQHSVLIIFTFRALHGTEKADFITPFCS